MDISSGFFTDMLLTLIGYAAVGAFTWTIYPIAAPLLKRFARKNAAHKAPSKPVAPEPTPAPAMTQESSAQFVRLQTMRSEVPAVDVIDDRAVRTRTVLPKSERRDRVDIIRIAREMLKAGADSERIKQVLPVSEAELALLTMQNN